MPYKNTEKQIAQHSKYYQEHKDEINKKFRERYHSHDDERAKIRAERKRLRIKQPKEEKKLVQRNGVLKHKFGITLEDFNIMTKEQNGLCAICGKPNGNKNLCVDHNHETNKVRALLCHSCNLALGNVHDDLDFLHKLVNYLEKYE